ncbi:MAG: hypothetical protein LBP87_15780 [Planctomycetaceae bacterium]|jgi:hypothetical protein|nr:hypothetical protein [Planctomycetaceae bacterium]
MFISNEKGNGNIIFNASTLNITIVSAGTTDHSFTTQINNGVCEGDFAALQNKPTKIDSTIHNIEQQNKTEKYCNNKKQGIVTKIITCFIELGKKFGNRS